MSTTTAFVEAVSEDPFVRELHRRVVRLLNDPTLDRQQREFHVKRLQGVLLEHQGKQAAKAANPATKPDVVASDNVLTGRNRPVLTLRRA